MLDWFLCSPGFNGTVVDDVALDCCCEFLCAGVPDITSPWPGTFTVRDMFWRSAVFSIFFER